MLRGERVQLRPMQEDDLDQVLELVGNFDTRGDFYPLFPTIEPAFRRAFAETGLWSSRTGLGGYPEYDEGWLVILNTDDQVVGQATFFTINAYYRSGYEIGYRIYKPEDFGKGYATETVNLLVEWLFGEYKINRLELKIHPSNEGSRRVAQKCGFALESTKRGSWYHKGE